MTGYLNATSFQPRHVKAARGVRFAGARWLVCITLAVTVPSCAVDIPEIVCTNSDDCPSAQTCENNACVQGVRITITEPTIAFSNSTAVRVGIEVSNFSLNPDAIGGTPVDGEGHWHLYVDGNYQQATADLELPVTRLSAGQHVIEVRLAENDHSETGVSDTMTLDISAESRGLDIVQPAWSIADPPLEIASDETFEIEVIPTRFTFVDEVGLAPATCACEGHWHLYIDGEWQNAFVDVVGEFNPTEVVLPGGTMGPMEPGFHEIEVRLAQNDHQELVPLNFDVVWIVLTE